MKSKFSKYINYSKGYCWTYQGTRVHVQHWNTFKAHTQTPKRFRVYKNKVQIILTGEWSTTGFACQFTGVWKKGMSAKPGIERDVGELVPHSSRRLWPRHLQPVSLFSLAWWCRVKVLFGRPRRNRAIIVFACLNSPPTLIECWIRVLARGVLQPAGKMLISSMFPNLRANKGLRETAIAMLFKMDNNLLTRFVFPQELWTLTLVVQHPWSPKLCVHYLWADEEDFTKKKQ